MSDYDHRTTVREAIRPSWDVDCDTCDWTDEADDALAAAILGLLHERQHLEAEVCQVRFALSHHLTANGDPCQDRGVDWPCDVARVLLDEGDET